MSIIWYLLKCQEGNEASTIERCKKLKERKDLQEVVCFQYQRMLRYGGKWHMERRMLLPGHIFLVGSEKLIPGRHIEESSGRRNEELRPCEPGGLKALCPEGSLIGMSRGIIRKGVPIVTDGPLKGQEHLIRKIDRHKRTAEIGILLEGQMVKATVGLEIYQKEM